MHCGQRDGEGSASASEPREPGDRLMRSMELGATCEPLSDQQCSRVCVPAHAFDASVEPSTWVNGDATTPEGAAAVMASPRPTSCAPRSQGISPSRGSDPDSRGRRGRRHGLVPTKRAAAAARCPRITKPSSAGSAANRATAASASATSPSVPRSSSVSTRTPVAAMPHINSCPWQNRWTTAARMPVVASSRSPRRAPSRARIDIEDG